MKVCSKCKAYKSFDSFSINKTKKDGLSGNCKECHNSYSKIHYSNHKSKYLEKAKASNKKYKDRGRKHIESYLKNNPCVDCGESDIEVLTFDHREMLRRKGGRVGDYLTYSIEQLITEISKCDVVCGNCHIRRTRKSLGWSRST